MIMNNNSKPGIQREINNLFIRTNILIREFSKCSAAVKTVLFKAHRICL